jgi:hypothetical protein
LLLRFGSIDAIAVNEQQGCKGASINAAFNVLVLILMEPTEEIKTIIFR